MRIIAMDKNKFFKMSLVGQDNKNVVSVVNQGIDARLTGFEWDRTPYILRLKCNIHYSEMEVLIRRLLELETEDAEMLADDIVMVYYGKESM
jgi:hypothetical protein